jgi:hypothetical protein
MMDPSCIPCTQKLKSWAASGLVHPLSKTDHFLPTQNPPHVPLHSIEPDSTTGLALQVIEKSCECTELPSTRSTRAMVRLLLMHWRVEMLIQALKLLEAFVTQVALIAAAVVVV